MVVIIMALWIILPIISVQPPCSRLWLVAGLGGKSVSANRGKLLVCTPLYCLWSYFAKGIVGRLGFAISGKLSIALEVRIVLPSSYSQAYLV